MRGPALKVDTSTTANDIELVNSPRTSSIHSSASSDLDLKKSFSPLESPNELSSDFQPPCGPVPSFRLLFSLIPGRYIGLLLLPAMASSIIAGGIAPFMTYVIGQAFDSFAKYPLTPNPPQSDKDALLHGVGF